MQASTLPSPAGISIHAPREGGDRRSGGLPRSVFYFNPRPPRGGRRHYRRAEGNSKSISIHAPREGGDARCWTPSASDRTYFNPRPPRGGRLDPCADQDLAARISIHAPREGGDEHRAAEARVLMDFNPRPPRGGRLFGGVLSFDGTNFNPRPPRGGRLRRDRHGRHGIMISIHAPREGGDGRSPRWPARSRHFNPRPPRGGRRGVGRGVAGLGVISIHAPREGGDVTELDEHVVGGISIHAPREGGDHLSPTRSTSS